MEISKHKHQRAKSLDSREQLRESRPHRALHSYHMEKMLIARHSSTWEVKERSLGSFLCISPARPGHSFRLQHKHSLKTGSRRETLSKAAQDQSQDKLLSVVFIQHGVRHSHAPGVPNTRLGLVHPGTSCSPLAVAAGCKYPPALTRKSGSNNS